MTDAAWWRDRARFAIDDADALVEASFACPLCLHTAGEVLLDDGDPLPSARCLCEPCRLLWTLELDGRQVLRLSLDPPAALWLRWDDGARFVRGPWGLDDV
jgi:hypothetical protein